jgi:hypothetical protein
MANEHHQCEEKSKYRMAHISTHVNVLRIPTGKNRFVRSESRINFIQTPEGIHVCVEIQKGQVRARLEGKRITARSRIKGMNAC